MKRKTFLASGLMLSIFYAIALVATIAMFAGSALLYFAADSFASIENIISQLLGPLLEYGALIMLIISAVALFLAILLLIASTRFIKYAKATAEVFARKKGLLVFYLILVILAMAAYIYSLVTDILANGLFELTLTTQVATGVVAFVHFLSVILLIVGFAKSKKAKNANPQMAAAENYDVEHPAIYTSDLEDKPEKQPTQPVQQQKTTGLQEQPFAQPLPQSESHRLVDEIGKLDAMRQNGEISQEQYVKLRQNLIRNFVK